MTTKVFNCPHCSITYKQERFLVKHIETKHNQPNDNNNTVSNDKPNPEKKVKKSKTQKTNNDNDNEEQTNYTNEKLSREEDIKMKIKIINENYELIFRNIINNSFEETDVNTRPINIDDCNFLLNKAVMKIKEGIKLKEMVDLYVQINDLV